ncbi:DUF499 domain-containing protein [Rhodococcus hoagii]|nr:DUF499 domain-containing protein [Prescottella equi]
MFDKSGSVGSPRKYRNSVVFAIADTDQIDALKDRARALIAADSLGTDTARLSQFSAEIRKKIEAYQKQASLEARIAVNRCYKHIYYPVHDRSNNHLRHKELPPQAQGEVKNATTAVITLLKDEGKIRSDSFTASYLRAKTWPNAESVTTADLVDHFWIDHSVPIVQNVALLREALVNGVKNEGWVYYDGSTGKAFTAHTMAGMNIAFRSDAEIMTTEEAQKRGLLIRKPTQTDLRAVFTGDRITGRNCAPAWKPNAVANRRRATSSKSSRQQCKPVTTRASSSSTLNPRPGCGPCRRARSRTRDSTPCTSSPARTPTGPASRSPPAPSTPKRSPPPAPAALRSKP